MFMTAPWLRRVSNLCVDAFVACCCFDFGLDSPLRACGAAARDLSYTGPVSHESDESGTNTVGMATRADSLPWIDKKKEVDMFLRRAAANAVPTPSRSSAD